MTAPPPDTLRRFLTGALPPDEAAAVSSWVESDATAVEVLRQTLAEDDVLTSALRSADREGSTLSPEAQRVIEQLAATPATLGGYRIEGLLGEGGMGAVYLARDERLDRLVALKTMRPEIAARPGAKGRFLREARAAALIEHDNVIPIWQVNEDAGRPFIAMPLLQGESLADRLRREPVLTLPTLVKIGCEVAVGLVAAHAGGLIHRDIKPANIWLEGDPSAADEAARFRRCKILDFGLARPADGDAQLTASGAVVGTPAYMSPEQASGAAVDARSDLFSLGVLLYRMGTGEQPFSGPSVMSILSQLAAHTPPPPSEKNSALPRSLSDLIVRLLSKDPASRPASARAVVQALDELGGAAERTGTSHTRASAPLPLRSRWRVPLAVAAGLLFVAAVTFLAQEIIIRIRDKDGKIKQEIVLKEGEKLEIVPGEGLLKPMDKAAASTTETSVPLQPLALVTAPAKLPGVKSWTVETTNPRGAILAADLSPDGRFIAAGGEDGVIRIWDTSTRQITRALFGHQGPIQFLGWFPDGKTLASGGFTDGTVFLWDTDAGKVLRSVGEFREKAALRPDGTLLAVSHDSGIQLYDVTTGKHVARSAKLSVCSFAWSLDGKTLALGTHNTGQVVLWSVAEDKVHVLPAKDKPGTRANIQDIAWSSDGRKLAAYGQGSELIGIWDVSSRSLLRTLEKGEGQPYLLEWTPDDQALVFTAGGRHRSIDATTGKVLWEQPPSTQVHFVGKGATRDDSVHFEATRGVLYAWKNKGGTRRSRRYTTGQGYWPGRIPGIRWRAAEDCSPSGSPIRESSSGTTSNTVRPAGAPLPSARPFPPMTVCWRRVPTAGSCGCTRPIRASGSLGTKHISSARKCGCDA